MKVPSIKSSLLLENISSWESDIHKHISSSIYLINSVNLLVFKNAEYIESFEISFIFLGSLGNFLFLYLCILDFILL